MNNYSDFFTNIVAKHLHKLVEIIGDSPSQKVLVHEWVLGIESTWRDFTRTLMVYPKNYNHDSEFISRLSFWIEGLRDKFNSNSSKNQVIELLYKTFDASTFCYFDYGTRDDVEAQIENYCKQVDEWFGESILSPKLKKFRLSKNVIPLINSTMDTLQRYGSNLDNSDIGISKDIRDASGLEKEFYAMFSRITEEFIISMAKNVILFSIMKSQLDYFLSSCHKLGYDDILSKKQNSQIEEIKNLIEEKKRLQDIINHSFDKLKRYFAELPEPNKHAPFIDVFSGTLKNIDNKKILQYLYSVYLDILKSNPKNGANIIDEIELFIKIASKCFNINTIEADFKTIKDKSYLKVKVTNFFRIAKRGVDITIKKGNKIILRKPTDEEGFGIFENLPKQEISIIITNKKKEKQYLLNIKDYYNEKNIWVFSI